MISSFGIFKHLSYFLISSLLLIIAIYFPMECLIPSGLHVLRMPISLANIHSKSYHFSIAKNASYCLLLEKDRAFPLQEEEYLKTPFNTLEDLDIHWKIEHNQSLVQQGTTKTQTFSGTINAKEVSRNLGCFEISKGNYIIHISINVAKTVEPSVYRILLDENIGNRAQIVALSSFYLRIVFIVIFTVITSTLSLSLIFKIAEVSFLKIKKLLK